jgi:hypothetical protein
VRRLAGALLLVFAAAIAAVGAYWAFLKLAGADLDPHAWYTVAVLLVAALSVGLGGLALLFDGRRSS